MFVKSSSQGQHTTYTYDTSKYNFRSYLQEIYNHDVDTIHDICEDLKSKRHELGYDYDGPIELTDVETDLHKKFYTNIKSNNTFKKMYCELIKDIYSFFYNDETAIIYQSFPSIRFQFKDSLAVPPHKDSDSLASHPIGEENFLVPITKMENTTALYIETEPDKEDFQEIKLSFGDVLKFNGNMCTHMNKKNIEDYIRISFDFRIIRLINYYPYVQNKITYTNPRDANSGRVPSSLTIGAYYQITFKDDSIDKMMEWYKQDDLLMQHRPTFDMCEAEKCYEYMKEDNFVTEHKKTKELETMICEYLNVKNCIMTTSCTSALIISLMALDLKNGDEIIVPNYTMIATVNAIKSLGLTPVLVDVNKNTYSLDLDTIKSHFTRKTSAIIHVSINNRYYDLNDIVMFCKEKGIYLIEDAAQSMGCKMNGEKYLGTYGDIACFSLSTPKIISSGQGGYMVTNNDDIALKLNQIKNFGRKESGKDIFEIFGINQKYTDIQAVITIEQMKKLNSRTIRMSEIYNYYYTQLKDYIKMIPPLYEGWFPWFVDIYCPSTSFREELMKYLKTHKIQTRPTYVEINKTNMYFDESNMKNTYDVSTKGLYLPCYVTLTDKELNYICNVIKSFILSRKEIVTYRKLELSDKKNYLQLMNNFRPTKLDMDDNEYEDIFNHITKNGTIIVAEMNGQLIGSITVLIEQKFIHNSSKYAHIEDVFVSEHIRNKKVGKNLVEKSIDFCRQQDIMKISLNCAQDLSKFYSVCGFEQRQINMSMLV
jgi:perosamine synthetase|uniref:N-acetyltransferase domain-containing protein n=1 Tax=viral metagenome TaxID=1070528 RepID=A0A6C0IL95_9ZZZZ